MYDFQNKFYRSYLKIINWLGVFANDGENVVRKQHQKLKAVTDGKLLTLNVPGQQLSLLET